MKNIHTVDTDNIYILVDNLVIIFEKESVEYYKSQIYSKFTYKTKIAVVTKIIKLNSAVI